MIFIEDCQFIRLMIINPILSSGEQKVRLSLFFSMGFRIFNFNLISKIK
jgi:hypothetical protein